MDDRGIDLTLLRDFLSLQSPGKSNDVHYSRPYPDIHSSIGWLVTMAMACHKSNGELIGVAALDLRLKDLLETVASFDNSEGYAIVLDQQGRIYADSVLPKVSDSHQDPISAAAIYVDLFGFSVYPRD